MLFPRCTQLRKRRVVFRSKSMVPRSLRTISISFVFSSDVSAYSATLRSARTQMGDIKKKTRVSCTTWCRLLPISLPRYVPYADIPDKGRRNAFEFRTKWKSETREKCTLHVRDRHDELKISIIAKRVLTYVLAYLPGKNGLSSTVHLTPFQRKRPLSISVIRFGSDKRVGTNSAVENPTFPTHWTGETCSSSTEM